MAVLPYYPEFDCESENKAAMWTKYVNRLKNYFTAYNIEDDKIQKAMSLTFVGEQTNNLIDELPSEQTTPEKIYSIKRQYTDKILLSNFL